MPDPLEQLKEVSQRAKFNEWLGIEVMAAAAGEVELRLRWRDEFGQYNGLLHAGVMSGVLETACGFAGFTVAGRVLASHFSMRCLRPAQAKTFAIQGRVVKPGRRQIFVEASIRDAETPQSLFALGEALLTPA